ncbi:rifin PIR protein, putative [Plasmodium reichenowi]|uniref:Rifin n=1 Tax=Plasmodium reichenowi TaxID=5854 RepID=A0A060RQK3_PLARE|nr:rifin [Plasmodium reichenowi]SOV84026.1 rifin PIR protein, putative [Plasmodium reichenowi]
MKAHYINILLFAFPLNIFAHYKNKPQTTKRHTPITRLLCECELYSPANYDNDQEMKEVMQQFDDRISQRFKEYDERMKTTRQKCKERCDKEIQKIILKDKLEKQMEQQLTTLETNIDTGDTPTCVCKKSMADNVEKACLRCTQNLGGIVAPCSGVLTGIAEGALIVWKMGAPAAAIAAAKKAGALAGLASGEAAGKKAVILALKYIKVDVLFPGIFDSIVKIKPYTEVTKFSSQIIAEYNKICLGGAGTKGAQLKVFEERVSIRIIEDGAITFSQGAEKAVPGYINSVVRDATGPATTEAARITTSETATLTEANLATVESTYTSCQTAIIASIVAIVIIILIMVIIYLILRYRRKNKMKKKLQYIKLLEE